MGFDLDKLPPAPWSYCPEQSYLNYCGRDCHEAPVIIDNDKSPVAIIPINGLENIVGNAIALLMNARDIQERRGWFAIKNSMGWRVYELRAFGNIPRSVIPPAFERRGTDNTCEYWSDPSMAMVEAEKWFVAHGSTSKGT